MGEVIFGLVLVLNGVVLGLLLLLLAPSPSSSQLGQCPTMVSTMNRFS